MSLIIRTVFESIDLNELFKTPAIKHLHWLQQTAERVFVTADDVCLETWRAFVLDSLPQYPTD